MTGRKTTDIGEGQSDQLTAITAGEDTLGECPIWWPERGRLVWVDIRRRAIFTVDPGTGDKESWPMPEMIAGLGLDDSGTLVVALESMVARFNYRTGTLDAIGTPIQSGPGMRFNEVKTDPQGRFWVGYMNDLTRAATEGLLFRVDHGAFVTMVDRVAVANSLAWSPDSKTMYFSDGVEPIIWSFDFDPDRGDISNRRVFARLRDGDGVPDGATVDSDGYVWSASYGGSAVIRYRPEDGSIDQVISLPASQPTSCTFGGLHLDTLFITTARQRMEPSQLEGEPLAGSVFAVKTDVTGLAEPRVDLTWLLPAEAD